MTGLGCAVWERHFRSTHAAGEGSGPVRVQDELRSVSRMWEALARVCLPRATVVLAAGRARGGLMLLGGADAMGMAR